MYHENNSLTETMITWILQATHLPLHRNSGVQKLLGKFLPVRGKFLPARGRFVEPWDIVRGSGSSAVTQLM